LGVTTDFQIDEELSEFYQWQENIRFKLLVSNKQNYKVRILNSGLELKYFVYTKLMSAGIKTLCF